MDLIIQINELLTLAAFLIGGGWALYRFNKFRTAVAKLNVDHHVQYIKESTNGGHYLFISLKLTNVGTVKISPINGFISLYDLDIIDQSITTPSTRPPKALLSEIEIADFLYVPKYLEPGETEIANIYATIPKCPQHVELYSCIETPESRWQKIKNYFSDKNDDTKPFGWNHTTIIDCQAMTKDNNDTKKQKKDIQQPDQTKQGVGRDRIGNPDPVSQGYGRLRQGDSSDESNTKTKTNS